MMNNDQNSGHYHSKNIWCNNKQKQQKQKHCSTIFFCQKRGDNDKAVAATAAGWILSDSFSFSSSDFVLCTWLKFRKLLCQLLFLVAPCSININIIVMFIIICVCVCVWDEWEKKHQSTHLLWCLCPIGLWIFFIKQKKIFPFCAWSSNQIHFINSVP